MSMNLARHLAHYAVSMSYVQINSESILRAKILLLDAIACAIAGFASEPSQIARDTAMRIHACDLPAGILGTESKSTLELATFANGVMIRSLDLNDSYFSRDGGHPSDNFASILTCADALHSSGRELIAATVTAYEVFCRLCDQMEITQKGYDHAVHGVISGVIGAAKILGLSEDQIVEALNIAIVSNISLHQTRAGEVSMWKCCALANANRNAVFAALIAKSGMSGPRPIFEGRDGFINVVSGEFKLDQLGGEQQPFRIMKATVKNYPCGQFGQTAIAAALRVSAKLSSIDEIHKINVTTCKLGKQNMAGSKDKWHPTNRETADHSIPYVVAAALMFGPLTPKHFGGEYLSNPDLHALIQKISVEESEECNQMYPEANATRVQVITKSGESFSKLVPYLHGDGPYDIQADRIEEKFQMLTRDIFGLRQAEDVIAKIWDLENLEDCSAIMKALSIQK